MVSTAGANRPEPAADRDDAGPLPEIEVRDARGNLQFWCRRQEAEQAEAAGVAYLERSGRVLRLKRNSGPPRLNAGDFTRRVRGRRHEALGGPWLKGHQG
jgi:hypothetical protein